MQHKIVVSSLTSIFSFAECDIFYDEELKIVRTRWNGMYVKGNEFRKIPDEILKAIEQTKSSTIIADVRYRFFTGGLNSSVHQLIHASCN